MPKGFFVTGTDTGVGKTIISGALIKAIGFLGFRAGGMKPIESGCIREGNVLVPCDGMFLKQFARMEEPVTMITPCCFESPLAPIAASEVDMTGVKLADIRRAFDKLCERYENIIVEGIGGLMVPITRNYFVIDMASEFGLPLIIVAKPGLGTINHTMLTVSRAIKEGLTVAGVVINYCQPPDRSLAEETNPGILAQILPVPILGIFPYLKNLNEEAVEKAAIKNLLINDIKQYCK